MKNIFSSLSFHRTAVVVILLAASAFFAYPLKDTIGLSKTSLEQEISSLRLFEEPLIPIGGSPTEEETKALVDALSSYKASAADFGPLENFLSLYPSSPWKGAILTNIGFAYYQEGSFSKAISSWEGAWAHLKGEKSGIGKTFADRAVGELMMMAARLGRMGRLEELSSEVEQRELIGVALQRVSFAKEGLWMMKNHPEKSFLCGPYALSEIASALPQEKREKIASFPSTVKGTSLLQLKTLSRSASLPYRMAYRERGSEIPVPSVIHWKVGHYAALVKRDRNTFLFRDPTFGTEMWIRSSVIDDEASGYFLIAGKELPRGWRAVGDQEGREVWGKGFTTSSESKDTGENSVGIHACSSLPMAQYDIKAMTVSLNIYDTPVGYNSQWGPSVFCKVSYNHREDAQPSVFTYTNFGPRWTGSFIAYVKDNPLKPNDPVVLFLQKGGQEYFYFNPNSNRSNVGNERSRAILVRVSASPIVYERELPDGSKEVYSESDGGSASVRKVFLKSIVDPQGNALTLNYDRIYGVRLVSITDAIGQKTTFIYGNADRLKVTRITDPFGRSARFTYVNGLLKSITDPIGIVSEFGYQGDFINSLKTPYGETKFRGGNLSEVTPERWLEATDAMGQTERVEFKHRAPGIARRETRAPQGFFNDYVYYRNTFHWDKEAYRLHNGDYTKARRYHWLHVGPIQVTAGVLESFKEPLESKIWYDYQSKPSTPFLDTATVTNAPAKIAKLLDDGTFQQSFFTYNNWGKVLSRRDPQGRTTSYVYAPNGIDLLRIEQGNATLLTLSDYVKHQPQTIKDASGKETKIIYQTNGQTSFITNAKGETTHIDYYSNGDVKWVLGPDGSRQVFFQYDDLHRIREKTGADGFTVSYEYDDLDRPTKISYPDGTYEAFQYDRLDLESYRDRQGRITTYSFNALRQLERVTDAKGQTTSFDWCGCGSPESITDGEGHKTSFVRDAQGRVIKKVFHDGSSTTYQYEPSAGRLKNVLQADGRLTNYEYYPDNNIKRTFYTRGSQPDTTPETRFTYDPVFNRAKTMTDVTGVTVYDYHPVDGITLGAGQLKSIDGPLSNDILAYEYDEVGRVKKQSLNGSTVETEYDVLGRVREIGNSFLGDFAYGYVGSTGRLRSIRNGGLSQNFDYFSLPADPRLRSITNTRGVLLISSFDYTYFDDGAVKSWGQSDIGRYEFEYDPIDQLASAKQQNIQGDPPFLTLYDYDKAGNRRWVQSGTVGSAFGQKTEWSPNDLNQLISEKFFRVRVSDGSNAGTLNEKTLEHDASGNLKSVTPRLYDPPSTYEWDAANRLLSIQTASRKTRFTYDGLNRWTKIEERQGNTVIETKTFIWCGLSLCEERSSRGTKRFFPQGFVDYDGKAYFYTKDHLGSIREVINSSLAVAARYQYDPYGRRYPVLQNHQVESDFGFTGHYLHQSPSPASGLYFAPFRAYDAGLGRWISRDPIGESGGLNLYGYVKNSPVNGVDPTGENPALLIAIGLGIVSFLSDAEPANAPGPCEEILPGRSDLDRFEGDLGYAVVGAGVGYGASKIGGSLLRSLSPNIGRKLEYFLGQASGSAHNIARSRQMLQQLESVGLHDNAATRRYLTEHLTEVYKNRSSISLIQENGRVVRESLLMGPHGVVKFETVWERNRLITGTIFGGRR